MVGFGQERRKIGTLRNVTRIVARCKDDPVKPLEPVGRIVARHIVALQERHVGHRCAGMRRVTATDGHIMALGGEIDGSVATQRTGAARNKYFHALVLCTAALSHDGK